MVIAWLLVPQPPAEPTISLQRCPILASQRATIARLRKVTSTFGKVLLADTLKHQTKVSFPAEAKNSALQAAATPSCPSLWLEQASQDMI